MIEIGTQYFRPPNPPRADWPGDFVRMRDAGLSTVKLWAVWGWMNPARGELDFDELDELMELARTHELRVVINIILESAPAWLEREAPHARYHDHEDRPVHLTAGMTEPGGGWPGMCLHASEVREAAGAFIAAVAARYARHPSLSTWDVWNEPRMEPASYWPERMYCYCGASLAAFGTWVRARYRGELSSLNEAWQRRYRTWEDVVSPRRFEAIPDLLDWREFWFEALAEWLDWRVARVRAKDPDTTVMTHVALSGHVGQLATHTNDEYTLTKPVERFGTSSFPTWLMDDDLVEHGLHLDTAREAAAGKPFWQSELQGGRGRRLGRASTPHPRPHSIKLWMWNALAAGATGILFWQWRPELSGPESPGYGLTLPDGTPTARVDAVAEMAAAVAGEPLLAAGSTPEAPRAGLLLSRRAALLCYGNDRDMSTYAAAVMGAYRALHDADVAVAPLHEDTIRADGVPGSVKALYWPLPMAADSALARALTAFVARGGRLVAESSPGQHGWHGRYATIVPGAGLDELFGVRVAETDVEHRIAIRLPGGGHLAGAWLRDQLRIGAAEVDATFTDGAPAITRRAHGAGTAVLVGTYPSLGYHEQPTAEARRWFADVLGHDPAAAPLRWAEPAPGRFHRVHRAADGRRFAIAINATETAAQLEHDGGQVTRLEPQTGRVVPL